MKQSMIYLLFGLILGGAVLSGNSGGAGNIQGVDRTGSPLGEGSCGIEGCHGGGAFNPTVTAMLLKGDEPVTQYEPGEDYRLRITVQAASGSPAGYGFQAVALTAGNEGAGTFSDLPSGVRTTIIGGRTYIEHSRRLTSGAIEVKWTAPASAGEVNFYAAGNAVNGNGSTSGDAAATLAAPLVVAPLTSSLSRHATLPVDWTTWPNPTADFVEVRLRDVDHGFYRLRLADAQGRILRDNAVAIAAGEHRERLDLRGLPDGIYFLQLSDGLRVATRRVVVE